jgi:hypothetical protein
MTSGNGRIQVADAFRHLDPNQKLAEGITGGFSRIGMKGKVWKLIHQGETYYFIRDDDGTNLPYLDVVFVGVNPRTSKLYYPPNTYTEDAANPPTCASTDGVKPDNGVAIPQSKFCNGCTHNEWLPNRGGKECQDHKRTAVILLPYMRTKPALPEPLLEPVFLKIPPASLKSFKSYSDHLNARSAHFASVITRVTFDPTKQFQLNFAVKQPLTNAEGPLVLPLLEDPQTRNLIGTIPEIKTDSDPTPGLPEAQETGLAAAFGGFARGPTNVAASAPKRGPGRPKKAIEAPKTEQLDLAAQTEELSEGPPQEQAAAPWEEGDPELDSLMSDILGDKISKMMPDK